MLTKVGQEITWNQSSILYVAVKSNMGTFIGKTIFELEIMHLLHVLITLCLALCNMTKQVT